MKTKLTLLLLILLIPTALAVSTDIKSVYAPGETLIIEIFGEILEPIQKEDVELKRNNVQVPWEYDIKKISGSYFLWGIVPNEENNYTILIKDLATIVEGVTGKINFIQNFSTSGDLISYSINPGFIITRDDEFEIKAFSNIDVFESIIIDFPEEQEIVLKPGENKIILSTVLVDPGFTRIQFGMYSVPVSIIKPPEFLPPVTIIYPGFRLFPEEIESTLFIDQEQIYLFRIINLGTEELSGIELEYNKDLFYITPETIPPLEPNDEFEINISIINPNIDISETIIARSGNITIELPVFITYTTNETDVFLPEYLEENYSETQSYYCSELNGNACTAGEICSGESVFSLDIATCCLGSCSSPPEGKSFAWVGYLIGGILLIVILLIAGRYLKRRKGKRPDALKRKTKEVEKKH